MLHKLLFLVFLFSASAATAQVAITPVKPAEKQADPEPDYKLMGMPMPEVRYILYKDTIVKKGANGKALITTDTLAAKGHTKKKKKHEKEMVVGAAQKVLTNEDLDNGANLFVMMFNPTCSHCQDETEMIEKNSALFKKSKLVLMASPIQKPYLNDFITYTHADQYASFIYLGIDSSDFTKKVFLYKSLPQINIYDKHRKLVKTYTGEVPIDSLAKYIQ